MYRVFYNNTPIVLSTNPTFEEGYTSIPIKKAKFKKILKLLSRDPKAKIHLHHKSEEKLFKHLYKKLPVVIAGGGKVFNTDDDILFIYRNKKWDLPKGKTEKKESIEETALREVQEETGVTDLEIVKFLKKTYHIFKRNGDFKLKVTYWFEMRSSHSGKLIPQTNEGITKAKWKNYKKAQKCLAKSYANIQLLFSDDYMHYEG